MANKSWIYGKNVLISGASSGIGFYISKILYSSYKCNVVGLGRNEEKLKRAGESLEQCKKEVANKKRENIGTFTTEAMDVSKFESWKKLKQTLDDKNFKIDVLINNAGIILPFEKFETQDLEQAKKVFDTNFFAHLYSYKTFIDDLKYSHGAIINISSSSALCPVVGTAIYSASKGASKSFTEALIEEHKKDLYVSYVCPGFAKTDLFRNEKKMSRLVQGFSMPAEKMAKKIVKKVLKKRKRIVIGTDAHFMSGLYRLSRGLAMNSVSSVLRASHDEMFDKVFPENVEKRKNKEKK